MTCCNLTTLEKVFKKYNNFDILNKLVTDHTKSTQRIVSVMNAIHDVSPFTLEEMYDMCNTIVVAFARDRASPFTPVGSCAAQSSIEPISQAILKSMHSAGKGFARAEILDMLSGKETDLLDTVYVYPSCADIYVAYRYLCLFVKRDPKNYIIKRWSSPMYYFISFDVKAMVLHSVTPESLLPDTAMLEHSCEVEDGKTILVCKTAVTNAQSIETTLLKFDTEGSIEWDEKRRRFSLRTEFTNFLKTASSEYVDRASIQTLNIRKVSKEIGILTAANLMACLLYDIYKFDPNTIGSLVGFACGCGDKMNDLKLQHNGMFASMFTGTVPAAAHLAATEHVDSRSAAHLLDAIALNQDSTTVGVTAVAHQRVLKSRV